jgi:hypothetical protein
MRRTSLVTILVFVAGLCIGYVARSAVGAPHGTDTHAADLAAIARLDQEDIQEDVQHGRGASGPRRLRKAR